MRFRVHPFLIRQEISADFVEKVGRAQTSLKFSEHLSSLARIMPRSGRKSDFRQNKILLQRLLTRIEGVFQLNRPIAALGLR